MSFLQHYGPSVGIVQPGGAVSFRRGRRRFVDDPDVTMAFVFTDGTLDPNPPLVGPILTFTRSTVGTFFDKFRVLQTAAIDAPRQ